MEKIIRSDKITSNVFVLRKKLYYKADKSDINDLVYVTFTEEKLSSYPLRILLFPVRGSYVVQVEISREYSERVKAVTGNHGVGRHLITVVFFTGWEFYHKKSPAAG